MLKVNLQITDAKFSFRCSAQVLAEIPAEPDVGWHRCLWLVRRFPGERSSGYFVSLLLGSSFRVSKGMHAVGIVGVGVSHVSHSYADLENQGAFSV